MREPIEIRATLTDDRTEVLHRIHASIPQSQRSLHVKQTLRGCAEGRISLDGLWEARRGGNLVAAMWAQPLPGRVGSLWRAPVGDESAGCEGPLIQRALADVATSGPCLVQALLPSDATLWITALVERSFRRLAELDYLVCI